MPEDTSLRRRCSGICIHGGARQVSLPSTALNGAGKLFRPQKYVHHCHIVEHEDNDMMEHVLIVP